MQNQNRGFEEEGTVPFCPDCRTTFQEDVLTCHKCHVDLLPDLAPAQVSEYVNWQIVCSVPNEVAGYILRSVLEDEGFQVYLHSHEMSFFGGIKGHPGKSEWGDILVPADCVRHAHDCIKAYYDSLREG